MTREQTVEQRVDALGWDGLRAQLDERGFAVTAPLLPAAECAALSDLFDGGRFRATVDMARHRFGDGRYRYFDHPLPDTIAALRSAFYRRLAPVANEWSARLGGPDDAFPPEHEQLLERCRAAGQERPTPLILRYGEGDWNALHQDLYGDVFFPFQVVTVLSERSVDYDGGQLVLLEQRPRAQSRAHVVEPAARRVRDLPDPASPAGGQARRPPGRDAPRREHRDARRADRARRHLPRRPLSAQGASISARSSRPSSRPPSVATASRRSVFHRARRRPVPCGVPATARRRRPRRPSRSHVAVPVTGDVAAKRARSKRKRDRVVAARSSSARRAGRGSRRCS